MLDTWFAFPGLLWTLLAVPAALALFVYAHLRKRQLTARLCSPLLLRRSMLVRPGVRRWKMLCVLLGLALTAIACAGPQWGADRNAQFRKGRDVVLVLDLSRSMSAEQPSRQTRAIGALRQMADAFENHGGNRVAFVAFAAQARLFFPFTQDCDHLRHTLAQIEADDYPRLSDKNPVSGTRIGAALKLAVDSCDLERTHRPIIVLLSDGDDPADDDEWLEGVNATVARKIPIHVVGVGNPLKAETIPIGRELLQFDGEIVRTKLDEPRMREIARRTEGEYLAAYREVVPLGAFVLNLLDADEFRHDSTSASLPTYQLRYAWFLLPAAILFMTSLLLNEGPRSSRLALPSAGRVRAKAPSLAFVLVAVICISAGDPPAVEALLRQGDDAFARQDYESARASYEKAEILTQDPGRLSFNKAAALYRLERYPEAIACYRRSLEDDTMPIERRARACFDLGNALVQQAGDDPQQLADGIAAYRAALRLAEPQATWHKDVRHNLELAQLLWLQARVKHPEPKVVPEKKPQKPKNGHEDKVAKNKENVLVPVDPTKDFKATTASDLPKGSKGQSLQSGPVPQVLPDKEQVRPLSPEQTLARLMKEAERIANARRKDRSPSGLVQPSTKDW